MLKKESYKNNFSYKGEKTKKLNIKNLRKKYKKKGLNYMIVNAEDIMPYKNRFVRDSIYITKKSINNKIKDFLYFVKDNLIDLGNAISDFLIS